MMKYQKPEGLTADHLVEPIRRLYGCRRNKAYNRAAYLLSMPANSSAPICILEDDIMVAHGCKRIDDYLGPVARYGVYRTMTKKLASELMCFTHGQMVEELYHHISIDAPTPDTIDYLEAQQQAHKNAVTAALRYLVSIGSLKVDKKNVYIYIEAQ